MYFRFCVPLYCLGFLFSFLYFRFVRTLAEFARCLYTNRNRHLFPVSICLGSTSPVLRFHAFRISGCFVHKPFYAYSKDERRSSRTDQASVLATVERIVRFCTRAHVCIARRLSVACREEKKRRRRWWKSRLCRVCGYRRMRLALDARSSCTRLSVVFHTCENEREEDKEGWTISTFLPSFLLSSLRFPFCFYSHVWRIDIYTFLALLFLSRDPMIMAFSPRASGNLARQQNKYVRYRGELK